MQLEVNKLKPLIGIDIADIEQDTKLEFILLNIEEIIRNYCNLRSIPAGLENTAYRMAMDLFRNEQIGNDTTDNQVAAIEEGDTKVSFTSSPYNDSFSNSLLKNYTSQLNRYRRMAW